MNRKSEKLLDKAIASLGNEFIVLGHTRVRAWHAWLIIGLAAGIVAGILFVANRSGEFEESRAIENPNLVGYYKLDELSGINLKGEPSLVGGPIGNSLSFDGLNDSVEVSSTPALQIKKAVSVSAWVKTTDPYGVIVSKIDMVSRAGYALEVGRHPAHNLPGRASFWVFGRHGSAGFNNFQVFSTKRIDDGQWHHVAGVFSPGKVSIYIDGILDGEATGNYPEIGANSKPLTIGGGLASGFLNGAVDDVRVYNKTLNAAEIKALAPRYLLTEYGALNNETSFQNAIKNAPRGALVVIVYDCDFFTSHRSMTGESTRDFLSTPMLLSTTGLCDDSIFGIVPSHD